MSDSLADRVRAIGEGTVPGLLFKVTAERLREHCVARSKHHATRAEEKAKQIPALEEGVRQLTAALKAVQGAGHEADVPKYSGKGGLSSNYRFDGREEIQAVEREIESLRKDVKDHANKSAMFAFLADSCFAHDYALNWQELSQLELTR